MKDPGYAIVGLFHSKPEKRDLTLAPVVVVEIYPVNHFVHGIAPRGESPAVQPADLQAPPQALGEDFIS